MIRSTLIAAATVAIAGALSLQSGGAFAETRGGVAVSSKGMDLSTPEGAKAFYDTMRTAASEVCGGSPTTGGIAAFDRYDGCVKTVLTEAVAKSRSPLVIALHAGKAPAVRVAGW